MLSKGCVDDSIARGFGFREIGGLRGVFKHLERRIRALLLDDIQKRLTLPREAVSILCSFQTWISRLAKPAARFPIAALNRRYRVSYDTDAYNTIRER